jgi:hypothetical protein
MGSGILEEYISRGGLFADVSVQREWLAEVIKAEIEEEKRILESQKLDTVAQAATAESKPRRSI